MSGAQQGFGTFSGAFKIDGGASFKMSGTPLNLNSDLTIQSTATLDLAGQQVNFQGNNTIFANNGSVINTGPLRSLFFVGNGAQHVATSAGTFADNLLEHLFNDDTLVLDGDAQLGAVLIDSGSALDISNRALKLSGAGTALSISGSIITTGSTVEPNGTSAQTVQTPNITYNSLTINNAAGVTMGASATVGGAFTRTSGSLSIGATTLTLNGAINATTGLNGGATSNLVIGGSGASATLPAILLNNLTMNRAAGITLGGGLDVNGILTLTSGNITAPLGSPLTIGSAGSISRTAGHIIGVLVKTAVPASFTFTVGTANGYTPLGIANATGGGNLSVRTVATAQPVLNPSKSLQEYWTLTATGSLTADLTFNYLQGDVMGNEAVYRIIKVTGGSAVNYFNNCPASPCVDTANNTASITGVSTFSDWTVGEPTPPTAIDLSSFAATGYDGGVYLQWQTGFEASNLGFNVHREQSGKQELVNQQMIAGVCTGSQWVSNPASESTSSRATAGRVERGALHTQSSGKSGASTFRVC